MNEYAKAARRAHDARESFVTELAPGAGLPHDATLEPKDETIAEVQALTVQSRQLHPALRHDELVIALSGALRRLIEEPSPAYAVAIATLALRLREEHLV